MQFIKESITLLVVDDEPMVLAILDKILKKKGFIVRTAASGRQAQECLSLESIDLVVCDIFMPGMDGFELLKSIKQKFPQIPVIMMTGQGDAAMVRKAMQLGADEYISKPVNGDELSIIIERISWRMMNDKTESSHPETNLKSG